MATKTKFDDKEFVGILSNYNLGEFVSSQPISKGTVQTNYIIQTTQGKFVFRYYENRSKDSVTFEINLIKYLKDRDYPCPAPMKDKKGKYVSTSLEKPFVIFEFIEGQHLENPTKAQKMELIQKVAELQNLTRNYRPRNRKYRWNYGIDLCRNLAQQSAQIINTANARKKLKWYLAELLRLNLPPSLPKGICHCDFHFSNILFKDGQFVALIDFDDANYTFLTFDLVTLLHPFRRSFDWDTWSKFKSDADIFDFREARTVVDEYSRFRPLSSIEKHHLFDVVKLSILLDCIWYFERGEASDFFEKRKIDSLNALGREEFYDQLFS